MFQMGFVPGLLRQAAALAYAPLGQIIPSDHPGTLAMGVAQARSASSRAIAPWNAALILSARSIAAPLALGNTVVLKPSELSPVVGGLIWGEIFAEAGLPAGVLNIVTHAPGEAAPIGDELVENPAVRRINFTGSTETGRRLAEAAGRQLKRVVLELGGYNPLIVLADADLDYAVNASAFGAFLHQGQICMSTRRIIVERPIADEFTARLAEKAKTLKAGDPNEHDTIIGPLINERRSRLVKRARRRRGREGREGARRRRGGRARATRRRCSPTCRRTPTSRSTRRSARWSRSRSSTRAEEAVDARERDGYGLSSAGILTADTDRGFALAQQLESGIVHVNDQSVGDEPQMPFGGVKDSGFGRFGGQAVVDEFTELRWITVQGGSGHPFPF